MSGNPFYSGRISPELFDHIEKYKEKTGETKTEILIRALSAYTGFALPTNEIALDNPLIERIELLEKIVKQNQSLIASHEEAITKIQVQKIAPAEDKTETIVTEELPLFAKNNSKTEEILSTKEATQKCGIGSDATIPAWRRDNKLPKIYNGYRIEFDHEHKTKGFFWKVEKVIDNT